MVFSDRYSCSYFFLLPSFSRWRPCSRGRAARLRPAAEPDLLLRGFWLSDASLCYRQPVPEAILPPASGLPPDAGRSRPGSNLVPGIGPRGRPSVPRVGDNILLPGGPRSRHTQEYRGIALYIAVILAAVALVGLLYRSMESLSLAPMDAPPSSVKSPRHPTGA